MDDWYVEEFKKKYEALRKIKTNNLTKKQKYMINETISTIYRLVYPNKETKYQQKINYKLEQDYWYLSSTNFLWPYVRNTAKIELPTYKDVDDYIDLTLDNEALFSLAYDFYKNATDKKSFQLFLKIFDKRKDTIRILNEPVKDEAYQGKATYLPFYNQVFITTHLEYVFNDITNLIHEFGHGIQYLSNYDSGIFDSVFSEVISIFYELISIEYFTKDKNLKDAATISQFDDFLVMTIFADDIASELNFLKKFDMTSPKAIKKSINNAIKKNPKLAQEIIDFNTSSEYPYVIGKLIAIELFLIYLQDRDKAFYLLNKIMNLKYSNNDEETFKHIERLGMHPMEHTSDYKNLLIRKMNNLNKK